MIVGIGIDLIEIDRIAELLQRNSKFVQRVLTDKERELMPKGDRRSWEYIAGRFAAKEAAAKALGTGIGAHVGFQDMEVLRGDSGAPLLRIKQEILAARYGQLQTPVCHLSISHSHTYAIAQVILEQA
ncbi:holo-ACP synthase [Brevibacillus sp. B_LB10_24]|uniref:holo-ACP synthase n=1 Tax=Brevibacillus sp. B_LB10_24 TaxID=3380645 RepID=UPI0038BD7159